MRVAPVRRRGVGSADGPAARRARRHPGGCVMRRASGRTTRGALGGGRRRAGATAVVVVMVLCLTLTASAAAWRHPSATERRAIVRVGKRTPTAAPHTAVRVSFIRISTVGPWAAATVTITVANAPDTATLILHKLRGRWTNANVGTSGEECVMPLKDRRNLGFGPYPCN